MIPKKRAQGSIEYLLIIGAAIVIVATVLLFVSNAIGAGAGIGTDDTFYFICVTLDSNTQDCGCYLGDDTVGGASKDDCCDKELAILRKKWDCGSD